MCGSTGQLVSRWEYFDYCSYMQEAVKHDQGKSNLKLTPKTEMLTTFPVIMEDEVPNTSAFVTSIIEPYEETHEEIEGVLLDDVASCSPSPPSPPPSFSLATPSRNEKGRKRKRKTTTTPLETTIERVHDLLEKEQEIQRKNQLKEDEGEAIRHMFNTLYKDLCCPAKKRKFVRATMKFMLDFERESYCDHGTCPGSSATQTTCFRAASPTTMSRSFQTIVWPRDAEAFLMKSVKKCQDQLDNERPNCKGRRLKKGNYNMICQALKLKFPQLQALTPDLVEAKFNDMRYVSQRDMTSNCIKSTSPMPRHKHLGQFYEHIEGLGESISILPEEEIDIKKEEEIDIEEEQEIDSGYELAMGDPLEVNSESGLPTTDSPASDSLPERQVLEVDQETNLPCHRSAAKEERSEDLP